MKKQSLTELIHTKWPHLHRLEVEAWIGRAWNTLMYEAYRLDKSNVDFYCKPFYGVAVEKDAHDQYFCTLPVAVVQLPDSADGVRRVMYEKDGVTVKFVPIERDAQGVFAELDINLIDTEIGYSVYHDKIVWECDPEVPTVSMDIVPLYEDYSDDDDLAAPMGFDVRLVAIVDQMINGTPMEDKRNN
jgi:hypothetical protein